MKIKKYKNTKINRNPEAFFMAAARAFSKNGYRRTTMNDIAEAADMSRPALYLAFKNKEHIFCNLVSYLISTAVDGSIKILSQSGPIEERFLASMLDFEKTHWGPIAKSQHALEIMDSTVKLDDAINAIKSGRKQLRAVLSKSLKKAAHNGDITFIHLEIQPSVFVKILMSILAAKKYQDTASPDYINVSTETFNRQNTEIIKIFLQSIISRP